MQTFRSLTPLIVATVAFLVAVPCAQSPVPTLEGYPAFGTPSTVKLLAPGAEPRVALRYRIAAGQKGTMAMATTMSMAMTIGETSPPATDMPIMKMTAELAVTNVAANGDITYDLAFTGMTAEPLPGMDPALAQMVQQSSSGITAVKGTATVSNRGVSRAVRLDLDKVTDPTLRQMLTSMSASIENMSMPLPEEAVGAGARWEVRQALQIAGTYTFQRAEYEVVSITGASIALRVTVEQTVPRQPVSNPILPPGATMEVEKMTGSGSGTMTLRLDNLVPTSELSSTTSAVMNATISGQTQRMTIDTKIKVTIAPGK